MVSFKQSNNTKYIEWKFISSWDPLNGTLVYNGTNDSQFKIGDILIEDQGLFIVSVSNITSITNNNVYHLIVKNSSIENAFTYLSLNGDLELQEQQNDDDVIGSIKRQLRILTNDNEQIPPYGSFGFDPIVGEFKIDMEFKLGPVIEIIQVSFYSGSYIRINCKAPNTSTNIYHGNLDSHSYHISCNFEMELVGGIDIPAHAFNNFEYTYYLYGGKENNNGGNLAKGKLFKFLLPKLASPLKFIMNQFLDIQVPLTFKFKSNEKHRVLFNYKVKSEIFFDYSYTPLQNIQIVPTQQPLFEQSFNHVLENGTINSCMSEIDISIGLNLLVKFGKIEAETNGGFKFHFYWNSLPNIYPPTSHGLEIPKCDIGYHPKTLVAGFSYEFSIVLRKWIFEINPISISNEMGNYLLSSYCKEGNCSSDTYSCVVYNYQNSCEIDFRGKYDGIANCTNNCKPFTPLPLPSNVCTTCSNPNCCNCPGRTGLCTSACSFLCPGDLWACCMNTDNRF